MRDLTLTMIQTTLVWEDIDANLKHFDAEVDALNTPTDLIILPEMFSTGFSMSPEGSAEPMNGKAVTWMRNKAKAKNVVITGSLMVREHHHYYNRLIWAEPSGRLSTYDKKHLFRYAGEEKVYTAGKRRVTVELNGWKVRPFICYDLRFPIWTRNINQAYDLAIFVANWPAPRTAHWRILLQARAIENQIYVAAVNRVGEDGNGLQYDGFSTLIDPMGRRLFEKEGQSCSQTLTVSHEDLVRYRAEFPAWMDADDDLI
jgi:predicted amidohydrolase